LLADLGNTVPAVPVLLGAGALAAWRAYRTGWSRWWLPVPVAAVSAALIPLLVVPAKAWFARPGPLGPPLRPHEWGWYPSGHTTTACISYGVAALLVGSTLAIGRRRLLHGLTALLGLGVGWGLVWCDYHWLLDVVAGWCLAGLLLCGLIALLGLARWGATRS
jgi:undecaprenyl-diphosphatase